jgi:Uma2 family endonuclease
MGAVLVEPKYHLELIDGREIQKPLPKKLHFLIQSYLIWIFSSLLREHYLIAPEANVWCGEDRLVPDVTLIPLGAEYDDGDLVSPPALCVEIMSPGQSIRDLLDKANRLVKAGAPSCWVIWPERRRAWSLTETDLIEETQHLTIRLNELEVRILLADLWAELARG